MSMPPLTAYRPLQTTEDIRNENMTLRAENDRIRNMLSLYKLAAIVSNIVLTVMLCIVLYS